MPSPSPIIEARVWMRIEMVKYWARMAATPSESAIERIPIERGSSDATTVPKAKRRRISVRGRTRASARLASAALARRRSTLSGASPVQPIQAFG